MVNHWKDIRGLKLQGLTHTSVTYDEELRIWTLEIDGLNVTGTSKAPKSSYVMGKHNWMIRVDKDCSEEETFVTELKMSGCKKEEFTCNDGQCVGIDLRCNQLPENSLAKRHLCVFFGGGVID